MGDLLYYGVLAFATVPILGFVVLYCLSLLTPWPRRSKSFFYSDRFHYNLDDRKRICFPKLLSESTTSWKGPQHTPPELYLSVIIPAMNEAKRLPKMLDDCLEYLKVRQRENSQFTYEIIVVDDGSTDATADVALEYALRDELIIPLRVCRLTENVGKGGAVRVGVLCARGKLILFADADGATTFSEFHKLEAAIHTLCNSEACRRDPLDWTHPAVVVGSRAHLESDSIVKRSLFRTILMIGFHLLVKIFAVRTIHDTQCGFKLFTRASAAKLFPQLHIERWAFDVELLYLSERLNFSMDEVAVEWTEIDGSKVTPVFSWLQMGRDIVLIWFRYKFKIWRVDDIKNID